MKYTYRENTVVNNITVKKQMVGFAILIAVLFYICTVLIPANISGSLNSQVVFSDATVSQISLSNNLYVQLSPISDKVNVPTTDALDSFKSQEFGNISEVLVKSSPVSSNKSSKIVAFILVGVLGLAIICISLITAFRATWRRHKNHISDSENKENL